MSFGADPDEVIITSDRGAAGACQVVGADRVRVIGPDLTQSAITAMKRRAALRGGNLVVSAGPTAMLPGGPSAAKAGSFVAMSGEIYLC